MKKWANTIFGVSNHKINKKILISDIISGILLLLLLYTALSKLADHETFLFVLKKSPLLHAFAEFIAISLPITELLVALLLFIPRMRLTGLFASIFLIGLFTVYLIYMITFSPDLPCQCGGALSLLTWKQHIFFNLFFIFLSLCGIFLYNKNKNRRSSPPP